MLRSCLLEGLDNILDDIIFLENKHGVRIEGCGCHGSPYLVAGQEKVPHLNELLARRRRELRIAEPTQA